MVSFKPVVGTERKSDQNFFIRPTNVEFHADSNGPIHSSIWPTVRPEPPVNRRGRSVATSKPVDGFFYKKNLK